MNLVRRMALILQVPHRLTCCFDGISCVLGSLDGTVRIWDMEIGDCVLLLAGHCGAITDLAAPADGRLLVSASVDHTARVWELEKGQCTAILRGLPTLPLSLLYSPSTHAPPLRICTSVIRRKKYKHF